MALINNIAGAAGSTSGSSGAPTDSGGIAGLLASLTAASSTTSPQSALAANSASGAPALPTPGSPASEPQKALWTKVFDFYQHASVDAGSALAAGQTLDAASTPDIAAPMDPTLVTPTPMAATESAALAGFLSPTAGTATPSALAASEALQMAHPAAMSPLLDSSASAARAKVISIRAGIAEALGKTPSSAKKENSAAQKGVSIPTSTSAMHPAAASQPNPVVPSPVVPSPVPPGIGLALQPVASQSPIPAKLEIGVTSGVSLAAETLAHSLQSGLIQVGGVGPGSMLAGLSGQSGFMLPGAPVGAVEKSSVAIAPATDPGAASTTQTEAKQAAKSATEWAAQLERLPSQPTPAAMRLHELPAGVRTLSAASSASTALADALGKPVLSTMIAAAQPDATRPAMTNAGMTASGVTGLGVTGLGKTASGLAPSSGEAAVQGSGPGAAAGSGSGHSFNVSSGADASAGAKSGAAIHGVTLPSGGAPGTWAATMIGHSGESAAVVTGAAVSGATSGTIFAANSAGVTLASGHAAPALHPGQVFESLDAAVWNPAQTARMPSGGASLSVGYQDARLGYVELQARQVAGGVQATLVPSSEAARQALEGQLGSLGGWLAQRATPVDRLAVGMPSGMAAMTTDHGGAMNPGGGMDQGRTPNQSLMQSMAQAAQQGLAGGGSGRGSGEGSGESARGNGGGTVAIGAVAAPGVSAGVDSGPLAPDRYATSMVDRGSAGQAMQNEMRGEAARIGVGQTISVRA